MDSLQAASDDFVNCSISLENVGVRLLRIISNEECIKPHLLWPEKKGVAITCSHFCSFISFVNSPSKVSKQVHYAAHKFLRTHVFCAVYACGENSPRREIDRR